MPSEPACWFPAKAARFADGKARANEWKRDAMAGRVIARDNPVHPGPSLCACSVAWLRRRATRNIAQSPAPTKRLAGPCPQPYVSFVDHPHRDRVNNLRTVCWSGWIRE